MTKREFQGMTTSSLNAQMFEAMMTGWQELHHLPYLTAQEIVQLLGETFPQYTVGLLYASFPPRKEEDEIVCVRIKPSLSRMQLLAWDSVFTRHVRNEWDPEFSPALM